MEDVRRVRDGLLLRLPKERPPRRVLLHLGLRLAAGLLQEGRTDLCAEELATCPAECPGPSLEFCAGPLVEFAAGAVELIRGARFYFAVALLVCVAFWLGRVTAPPQIRRPHGRRWPDARPHGRP